MRLAFTSIILVILTWSKVSLYKLSELWLMGMWSIYYLNIALSLPQHIIFQNYCKCLFRTDPTRGPWTVRYNTMRSFLEYCPDTLVRSKVWHSMVTFGLHEDLTKLGVEIDNIRSARYVFWWEHLLCLHFMFSNTAFLLLYLFVFMWHLGEERQNCWVIHHMQTMPCKQKWQDPLIIF